MHEIGARVEDPMMAGALVPRQDLTDAYFGERAAYWNEIYAEGGLQGLVYRKRMQAALAWIDALGLAPGSKVLEVGCGAGFATLELARPGYAVHSSDSSADMVALASTGSPRPASEMLLSPSPTCTTSPMAPGASSWSSRSASCPGCIPRSARWGRSRGCLRPAATRSSPRTIACDSTGLSSRPRARYSHRRSTPGAPSGFSAAVPGPKHGCAWTAPNASTTGSWRPGSSRSAGRPSASGRSPSSGRFWIAREADGVTVRNLKLNDRNPDGLPSPTVNANNAVFRDNNVSNRHTGICFAIGSDRYGYASGTVIKHNRIHDCGRLPATNHDHGIYVANADGAVIEDNLIYQNADRGIQLFPDADESLITGNVIDSNGQGVIISGDDDDVSEDNLVEGNVI